MDQKETIILKFENEYEFNSAIEEIYYAYNETSIEEECDCSPDNIKKLLMEYLCDDR